MSLKRIIAAAGLAATLSGLALVATAPAAMADPCGYWTTWDAKYFTNCSGHNQKIQVDYQYGSTQQCSLPGTTRLYDGWNNPVTNAFVVAQAC